MENIVAVCISKRPEEWSVSEILFYCHTEGYREFQSFPPLKTIERIEYLAERRNKANQRALELYPRTEYIFSVDSYHVTRVTEILRLVSEYQKRNRDIVLGGAPWFHDTSVWPARRRFWDTWATPELTDIPVGREGWLKVRGCGGFTIYPRWLWEERGFGVPYPFPESGCEVNYLCNDPRIETYVTLNVKPERATPKELLSKPLSHRLRTRLALGRLLGGRREN